MATNSLGVAAEEVEVSGRPLAPSMLHGGPPHPSQTEYTLRWRTCALNGCRYAACFVVLVFYDFM